MNAHKKIEWFFLTNQHFSQLTSDEAFRKASVVQFIRFGDSQTPSELQYLAAVPINRNCLFLILHYVIYVFKTFLKMSYIFWASISSNVFRKLSFKQMNIFVNIFLKRAGDIWIDDNTFLMRRAWFFLCCSCYCSVPKYITGMVTSASFLF